jgi:hypothetical protein
MQLNCFKINIRDKEHFGVTIPGSVTQMAMIANFKIKKMKKKN